MTIDEAKDAVKDHRIVIHSGFEYYAVAIITWHKDHGQDYGWRNSLRLVPLNGADSVTEALARDCSLKQ